MKRRNFIAKSIFSGLGLSTVGALAFDNLNLDSNPSEWALNSKPFFKLSLAQWSLNKAIRYEGMNPYGFATKAKEYGFEGLENVNQL